jgi:hypothetical protein
MPNANGCFAAMPWTKRLNLPIDVAARIKATIGFAR